MSLKLENQTPFSVVIFEQIYPSGQIIHCLGVRATFRLSSSQIELTLDRNQNLFSWIDEYNGSEASATLKRQSDFIAYKPGTDITIQGYTYSPSGQKETSWVAGLLVKTQEGALLPDKRIRVFGERFWRKMELPPPKGWSWFRSSPLSSPVFVLTEAQKTQKVPLIWQRSAGGRRYNPEEKDIVYDLRNPVGLDTPLWDGNTLDLYPAPQFEALNTPLADSQTLYDPVNFAPIHPAWTSRLMYAGTYNDLWKNEQWPLLPQDFDYRFYQCAPQDQIITPWLEGNE
jgi:hypothetical protein